MIKGVILDLDGTVYRGDREVPGASRFVRELNTRGIRCLFVTNRANRTPRRICDQLGRYGIACEPQDVLTSGQATAQFLGEGSVFFIGGEGLEQALLEAGLTIDSVSPDHVVVSFDPEFTYEKMRVACRLIDRGARYVATNPDKGLKTSDGIEPGTGAIVAAVSAAAQRDPVIVGKPEKLIFEMALRRLSMEPDEVIVIGDNIDTDIPAGDRAGLRTALLLTGISCREDAETAATRPTWVVDNYDELTRILDAL